MWGDPEDDPGGSRGSPGASSEDSNPQSDQALIAQLKQVIGKNEQSRVTQEKVEEYVNTLKKIKAKRTKNKKDDSNKTTTGAIDSNKKDRINLLRQQLEENKVKLAERGKNQKGIEDMVSQLQAQFNDSQQLINPLNASLIDTKPVDYSLNCSKEELYNILLNKEKRITELASKVHKFEGNVFDLQENLKEKDSVIDARTRAITLMTESLSKKGKTTLDALDDTKLQMQSMQTNFVQLEEEMKARQLKLLEDLKAKNLEINDLHETVANLESEKKSLVTSIQNSEKQKEKIDELQKNWTETDSNSKELEAQIEKLKKQLDEGNKSMIKAQAQSKSKIKALHKKLDAFKKMSDSNALIAQLQAENSKLNEKIAELEEEKGNIQLNLVDSELDKSGKAEKDKIISILEDELRRTKNEVSAQVSSEFDSIQFEEQIDKLMSEKADLLAENEALAKTNLEQAEKIEALKKEMQELSGKLNNYVQENMELVDKLEKLSAEKLSSAESIEIVEGLTQQEKLELAAYQKNVDVKEEILETPVELNESVSQLNEDSTELLQKIDMFNMERREVMDKLEELKEENSHLSMKIKEIENNRDILAEAYEQLQNEKERQDDEISSLKVGKVEVEIDVQAKLNSLQVEFEKLQLENEGKARELTSLLDKIAEKDVELEELNAALAEVATLENTKLNSNFDVLEKQLGELKSALTEQMQQAQSYELELEQNSATISELNGQLAAKSDELAKAKLELNELTREVEEKDVKFRKLKDELGEQCAALQKKISGNNEGMDKKVEELSVKNKEMMEKMKKIAANLKKKSQAYQELEGQYKSDKEKWEYELQEKDEMFKKRVFELEHANVELQNAILDLSAKKEVCNELSLKQELSASIHEDFATSEADSSLQKINELEIQIENQESELAKHKERANNLEETLARLTEEKEQFEVRHNALTNKYQELLGKFQDKMMQESEMEMKLQALASEQENLQKCYNQLTGGHDELLRSHKEVVELNEKLKKKIVKAQSKVNQLSSLQATLQEFEAANEAAKQEIVQLHSHLKHLQNENENLIQQSKLDIERIENDFQLQLEEVLKHKNELAVRCEKLEEAALSAAQLNAETEAELSEYKVKEATHFEQLQQLNEEVESVTKALYESHGQIEELGKQLLVKTANDTVDCIISEAEAKVLNPPTFQWPEKQSESVFDTLVEPQSAEFESIVSEDSKESLLKKIKTLEFMLYNVEKDKNDTLLQCHEMSNELTQLVYERENAFQAQKSNLEAQILSEADLLVQPGELQQLEFTKPSAEEHIQPTDAYLCYQPADLESQILSDFDLAPNPKELQQLEFTPTNQTQVEEPIRSETAYVCFKNDAGTSTMIGENDDGWGWGPEEGRLEAEHENQNFKAQFERAAEKLQLLQNEREAHLEEIKQLQLKSGKLIKKCKELKVKNEQLSSKAARKTSQTEPAAEFFNLDETIQEELKAQLVQLEKRMREVQSELEKERGEKTALLGRSEGLAAANERLVEVKEKQSLEIVNLQRSYQELGQKLERYEWGDDGFNQGAKVELSANEPDRKIEELNAMVKELSIDNEELQSLLDEQRKLRSDLEKVKMVSVEEYQGLVEKNAKLLEEVKSFEAQKQANDAVALELSGKTARIQEMTLDLKHTEAELVAKVEEVVKLQSEKLLTDEQLNEKDATIALYLQQSDEVQKLRAEFAEKIKQVEIELALKLEEITTLNFQIAQLTFDLDQQRQAFEFQAVELTQKNQQLEEFAVKLQQNEAEFAKIEENAAKLQVEAQNSQLQAQIAQLTSDLDQRQQSYDLLAVELSQKNQQLEEVLAKLQQSEAELMDVSKLEAQQLITDQNAQLSSDLQQQNQAYEFLVVELNEKNAKLEELAFELQRNEAELTESKSKHQEYLAELNESWQLQVDQRGSDVAESWRLHLETIEADFTAIQSKQQTEIAELDAKCNALMNENNELRRNVDAEIRSEVDRISALQQQSNERQAMLQLRQSECDNLLVQVAQLEQQIAQLQSELKEKDSKLSSIDVIIETTQRQFDEKREVVEDIVRILERKAAGPLSFEKQEILAEFERQLSENVAELSRVSEELLLKQQDSEKHQLEVDVKESEKLRAEEELRSALAAIDEYVFKLRDYESVKEEFDVRQGELAGVRAELDAANALVNNYSAKLAEYEDYHAQMVQQKDEQIQSLIKQMESTQDNRDYTNLEKDLSQLMLDYANLQQSYTENQQQLASVNQYYSDKCGELNNYELEVLDLRAKLQERVVRVDALQLSVAELQEIVAAKDATLAQYLAEAESKIEQESLVQDETRQLDELRGIIENQVIKIEELKKELFMKSNEYDSLIAEVDISNKTAQQDGDKESAGEKVAVDEDDLLEAVSRAEYDLALYLLHQSDCRCEELTVELTQLLEERDTLQLRLSNTLREKEEIRRKIPPDELNASGSSEVSHPTRLEVERADEATSEQNLATKINELHSMDYKKDKRFVDEQEFRNYQHLSIMQQHINEASKLPPEAAAKLLDASYTLSRDVQSPSKVLLNWLWGRSTPKQNES